MSDPMALLPAWLNERALALNDRPVRNDRPLVLYWMRVAMRGHDNPALEAALHLAHALDRPLLVYQGLSERYPYASDRHHRFILEAARDVAIELAGRGLTYAFHLERPGARGDHLLNLARSSAAVVTEIFPWTPLARWTERVARHADCSVLTLDASCLVPMPTVRAGVCDRAFRFREATAKRRTRALSEGLPEPLPAPRGVPPELPFPALDLAAADLPALIGACEIDHTVAPVPHTPGGTRAGMARWAAFRDGALQRYHRRRNDPLDDGVSRMSPYLHCGQVSPFRMAREVLDIGGDGAAKFLDELLVWRELAWSFCFHHPEHETLAALPTWARSDLDAARDDPRPALYDWETLARGRTGDALWNAAQTSLLIHGELHNNVRMTWGKMLPRWTEDPAKALARLIDLNHRYALDGRDPNAYGGILWCLGQFDRPFEPPRPILGRVRDRDTAQHARRLDVQTYADHTRRPAISRPPRVAVVGAGAAGLMAARTLKDHGLAVSVYDKGRRPGGRVATRTSRRMPDQAFDHGVAGFAVTDPRLACRLDAWAERGLLAPWRPREGGELWIGMPDANALARDLASDLGIRLECEITRIERKHAQWWLTGGDGSRFGPFEALLLNLPPAQAARLLEPLADAVDPSLTQALATVPMRPCWSVMTVVDAGFDPGFDRLERATDAIALACREASKPGRSDRGCFTFHSHADFAAGAAASAAAGAAAGELEAAPDAVAAALAPEISSLLDRRIDADALRCHHWRYARAAAPATAALDQPRLGLYFCGDWCSREGDLEGALLSGCATAGRLLGDPPPGPPSAVTPAQGNLFA